MTRSLKPEDVFSFISLSEARIAPDGGRIIVIRTRRDIATDARQTSLLVSRDRASWIEVAGSEGVVTARFFPDGQRIAMLRRGADGMAIAMHEFTTGTTRTLFETGAPLRELAVDPAGARLGFQMRIDAALPAWLGFLAPPDGASWAAPAKFTDRLMYRHDAIGELPEAVFQIFVISADGGAPRQITHGPWFNGFPHHVPPGLVFSTDGRELLVTGTTRPNWDVAPADIDIHAISVADGTVRRLTEIPGPVAHPAPAPNGHQIAFTAVEERGLSHQLRRLYVMSAAGGAPREVLPGFDRSIGEIAWAADGKSLVVTYDDHGSTHLARVDLDGGVAVLARNMSAGHIEMPYAGAGFSAADDGTIVYVRSAADTPCEVGMVASDGSARTLTSVNAALAAEVGGFHGAEMFWVTGGEGRRVQCWLMRPRGPGPHPLVLEIHGGPYAQYGDRFAIKYQLLAAAGYAVLFTNPCGSTGYGEDFANALHDRFPGPDFDDLMAAVDAAVARPDIDGTNQFVTGVSGGGVLTCWSITHTHRFRAAVAIKPVTDWQSWLLSADVGPSIGRVWMGGDLPWEASQKFHARSPLSHVGRARTPTLLMAGEADSRTPAGEAQQMYAALKLAGVEAALLRFPATSHSSSAMRPSLFAAEVTATIGWFEKHRLR